MYLPNIPTLDDEMLLEWIKNKIVNGEKENIVCDYKERLVLSDSGKGEMCKDICGFANEIGGCVLIGVPEERGVNGKSIGIPSKDFGIPKQDGLVLALENLLRSGISPTLPALHVRELCIDTNRNLFVYVIYHPKSWLKPHMVTLNQMRYYTRGEESTQRLQEHQISFLYEERHRGRIDVLKYFKEVDFGMHLLGNARPCLKVGVIPLPYRENSFDLTSEHTRIFLNKNSFLLGGGGNYWIPNKDGAITIGNENDLANNHYVTKIHHSGALTFASNILSGERENIWTQTIAHFAFESGIKAFVTDYLEWISRDVDLFYYVSFDEFDPGKVTAQTSFSAFKQPIPSLIPKGELSIGLYTNSRQIIEEPGKFQKILEDKLANLVGLWSSPKT